MTWRFSARLARHLAVVGLACLAAAVLLTGICRGPRTGAICRDGWQSSATGQGACSHHGGVARWIYEERNGDLEPFILPIAGFGAALLIGVSVGWLKAEERNEATQLHPPPVYQGKRAYKTGTRCPRCGGWLVRRTRRRDGAAFLGCSNYPRCRYTRSQ